MKNVHILLFLCGSFSRTFKESILPDFSVEVSGGENVFAGACSTSNKFDRLFTSLNATFILKPVSENIFSSKCSLI